MRPGIIPITPYGVRSEGNHDRSDMTPGPLDDAVAQQYERWVYPEPIADLPAWLEHNWQWFDPSHAHVLMWPDRPRAPGMDILVAGCGTNQAAVIAFTNPGARVLGIDVSQASLGHNRALADAHAMANLELLQLPIEQVGDLGRDFDLIISTGVLHHMADPAEGMSALGRCLRADGVLAIMLYARTGRVGVEMLQAAFRDMGLAQDAASVRVVRQVIDGLPADHPVRAYLGIAPDLGSDAGVVDTFLHGRDRSFTVAGCLELVAAAGLVFQDWFLKAPYHPMPGWGAQADAALAALPTQRQWQVMEALTPRNGCHFFLACRHDRPASRYRVDLLAGDMTTMVPSLRYRCALEGDVISRPGWNTTLQPAQRALASRADGVRTLDDIVRAAADDPALAGATDDDLRRYARELFQSLWQQDFLQVALRAG